VEVGGEHGEHGAIIPDSASGGRPGGPECQNASMATVTARASKAVNAPPERVLEFLRDYRESRPKILTDNYTAYRVEQGGEGTGTIVAYHFESAGRGRDYRLKVE